MLRIKLDTLSIWTYVIESRDTDLTVSQVKSQVRLAAALVATTTDVADYQNAIQRKLCQLLTLSNKAEYPAIMASNVMDYVTVTNSGVVVERMPW